MIELTRDLLDAIHDAIKTEQLADRRPWKVAIAPDETLATADPMPRLLLSIDDGHTVFGLPVRVDERVPRGAVALVSQAGAVVAPINPTKETR